MTQSIVLQLLDPAQHRPLQVWTFPGTGPVTIGRADENDVVLADPFVSRTHARLEMIAGSWRVISLSSQQLLCDGKKLTELPLEDGMVFRLGARGCVMRFSGQHESEQNRSTMIFDADRMPVFQLDAQQLEREVAEISSGDYFRELQQAAQRIRQRRESEEQQS